MAEENKYREWSRMEEAQLAKLLASDMPRQEIAGRLGRSCSAIVARIARLGIADDVRRRFSDSEDRTIRAARTEGATYAAIARRLGRSEGAVKCRARRLGIVVGRGARIGVRKPVPRKCLMHGGRFQPGHRHEFVCIACKESEEWQAGSWMG
jgi:ParB-like chromosome segregation protein Spo0J